MLKVSKAEKVKYPKPCAWCDQAVQFGPFTHGKVKDTDTRSVLLHGDLGVPGSCAYKFAQGQLPLPTATVESTLTIAPKPDFEDYVIILRDDMKGLQRFVDEIAKGLYTDIARLDARAKNMENMTADLLIRMKQLSPAVVYHPANEVE